MGYVLPVLVLVGKVVGWAALALILALAVLLSTPVRLRLTARGRATGWSYLLEDEIESGQDPEEKEDLTDTEGSFESVASVFGGLAVVTVKGCFQSPVPVGATTVEVRILGWVVRDCNVRHPGGVRDTRRAPVRKGVGRKTGEEPKDVSGRSRRAKLGQIVQALRREDLRREVWHGIRDVWRALHPEAGGDMEIGLGDPGLTGMVYGIGQSFLGALGVNGVTLKPRFDGDVLAGKISMTFRFIPLRVGFFVVRTLLARPVRLVWLERWRERESRDRAAFGTSANR